MTRQMDLAAGGQAPGVDAALVLRYRVADGQEFVHTGEYSMGGDPLYAEARTDWPTALQATAAALAETFGELTVLERQTATATGAGEVR